VRRNGPSLKRGFISNLGDTEEEADESLLCLECLDELATREHPELKRLLKEVDELVAILTSSRKTARG
jgi:four helix bundle protein